MATASWRTSTGDHLARFQDGTTSTRAALGRGGAPFPKDGQDLREYEVGQIHGPLLDGLGISGTNPVRLGLSVKAIIDETPQWMTATDLQDLREYEVGQIHGPLLDGLGISGANPVRLGLSVKAIIDETPQWMTATGGKSVSGAGGPASSSTRSEEHTSELQSLRHLVCR